MVPMVWSQQGALCPVPAVPDSSDAEDTSMIPNPEHWRGAKVEMHVKQLDIGRGKPSPGFISCEIIEAVSDSGVYVHSGYEPRHGFKNMHFLPWRLIDSIKVVLPAKVDA